MSLLRKPAFAVVYLLIVHAVVLGWIGARPPGPILSCLIQLVIGVLCVTASLRVANRSNPLGRYFWYLMAFSFIAWSLAQSSDFLSYFFSIRPAALQVFSDLMFVFSSVPMGMALFLDPEHEYHHFDRIHLLDFAQTLLFWLAGYLYFSYLPSLGNTKHINATLDRASVYDAVLVGILLSAGFPLEIEGSPRTIWAYADFSFFGRNGRCLLHIHWQYLYRRAMVRLGLEQHHFHTFCDCRHLDSSKRIKI